MAKLIGFISKKVDPETGKPNECRIGDIVNGYLIDHIETIGPEGDKIGFLAYEADQVIIETSLDTHNAIYEEEAQDGTWEPGGGEVSTKPKIMSIDIETYCDLDLLDVGVYKYAEHESFEILMIAYAFDESPVQILDLKNGGAVTNALMPLLKGAIEDPEIKKHAYNANFERTCLAKHFNQEMPPEQWACTMVHAAELGLPGSLAQVGEALNLDKDQQKMKEGKALISFFCKPCKPTKKNGQRTRNLPEHDPDRWNLFLEYCKQDVVTEQTVKKALSAFPIPDSEQKLWELDQKINDRGIRLDTTIVENAIELDTQYKEKLMDRTKHLTQLANPNSLPQLKTWIQEKTGMEIKGLTKTDIPGIIEATDNEIVKEVLQIRQELAKTSTSKYYAMDKVMCQDERARGVLQFYGANRTGRWAGRLIQVQNLPQNKIPDLDLARSLLREKEYEAFEMLYGNVPDTLSQLIRTAFIPAEGNKLYVADFSAIEARMIAWVAQEKWRMEVFNDHGKIYEASAAQMFNVDIDTIAKGHENYALRAKGKIAELALGYGGSVGALEAMGALNMGLEKEELKPLVNTWRKTNPGITDLWWSVDAAAVEAVRDKRTTRTHGLEFSFEAGILFIKLHSGRRLAYVRPRIEPDRYGKDKLRYEGMDQVKKKWTVIDTYGPKLVENIIQALSRDCLAFALTNLEAAGYPTAIHVHDESVIDRHGDLVQQELETIEKIMAQTPEWAEGLPLNADGYYCDFYQKD